VAYKKDETYQPKKYLVIAMNVYNNLLLAHYCVGDKIKKNNMGGACSLGGGGERCVQGFGGGI
jgi:hypothetical protein